MNAVITYSKGTAKVMLSDGSQSPKLKDSEVNEWIRKNAGK